MNRTKRVFAALAALLMILSLAACGGKSSSAREYGEERSYNSGYYNSTALQDGMYGGFAAAEMYDYEEAAPAAGVPAPSVMKEAASGAASEAKKSSENTEKIIYSGNATVESTEYEKTLEALQQMIDEFGGWVESSSANASSYGNIQRGRATNRSAFYVIRVPGANFSAMMGRLSNLGNVPSSSVSTENVTSQYYDTQARLKTYEAQEQRLIELLDMAKKVSDVIEIENELTEVRYKIESLQTQLNGWDRRVSYSTITLSVNEVSEYTPEKAPSYGKKMLTALRSGIEDLGDFLIDFVGALPVLIIIGLILWGVIALIRRMAASGKARRERRKAEAKLKAGAEKEKGKEE